MTITSASFKPGVAQLALASASFVRVAGYRSTHASRAVEFQVAIELPTSGFTAAMWPQPRLGRTLT